MINSRFFYFFFFFLILDGNFFTAETDILFENANKWLSEESQQQELTSTNIQLQFLDLSSWLILHPSPLIPELTLENSSHLPRSRYLRDLQKFRKSLQSANRFLAFSLARKILDSPETSLIAPPCAESLFYSVNHLSKDLSMNLDSETFFDPTSWILPASSSLVASSFLFSNLIFTRTFPKNQGTATEFYQKFIFSLGEYNSFANAEDEITRIPLKSVRNRRLKRRFEKSFVQPFLNQNLQKAIDFAIDAKKYALNPWQEFTILRHLAWLYERCENLKKQIEILEQAVEIHPDSRLHLLLAYIYSQKKDWVKMDFHNKKALTINPSVEPIEGIIPKIRPIEKIEIPKKIPEKKNLSQVKETLSWEVLEKAILSLDAKMIETGNSWDKVHLNEQETQKFLSFLRETITPDHLDTKINFYSKISKYFEKDLLHEINSRIHLWGELKKTLKVNLSSDL